MPIDLTQFHEGFFEEAAEHIERMESLLLEIDLASPDSEKLNAIFRAAHSIKGGSGTFGLTAMKEFTHVLESLLDRVRHGEIELSVPLIDVFLEAGDVLREQLARYRDGKSDDPVRAHEVGARLKALTNTAPTQETARAKQPLEASNYDIEFTSSLQEGQRGAAYDGLLSALRASGTLTVDSTQDASTSPWKFALAAAISPEAIYDIFDYINVPGDTLRVERSDSRDEPMPEDEAGFGFFDDAPGAPAKMPQVAEQLPDWNGDERRRKAAELG
jgi:two-component system, chemotaxis family, sensor kinase CheA